MIHCKTITNKKCFWNIIQKYYYEMSMYYGDEMDEEGNYRDCFFDCYFADDPERKAIYLMHANTIVGFALINQYSHLGSNIDYAMAEFTIFPAYRQQGYGKEAFKLLLSLYPGTWEIKYHKGNRKAALFWTKMTEAFSPSVTNLNEEEQFLSFSTDTR